MTYYYKNPAMEYSVMQTLMLRIRIRLIMWMFCFLGLFFVFKNINSNQTSFVNTD